MKLCLKLVSCTSHLGLTETGEMATLIAETQKPYAP